METIVERCAGLDVHKKQIGSERTRQINRVHKILEDANIKLGVVASDDGRTDRPH